MIPRSMASTILMGLGFWLVVDVHANFQLDNVRRFKWENRAVGDVLFDRDFNLAQYALEDYANGGKASSIPLPALKSMSAQLGRLIPHTPSYFAGEDGPVLSTTDVKREPRYALALSPVNCNDECPGCSKYSQLLCDAKMPDPMEVWKRLLRREDDDGVSHFVPETAVPANFLMITFVNWFHDDTFRTVQNTNGSKTWRAKDGISLAQVYGDTPARERVLRTLVGGKMRTSTAANGEVLPPRLEDVLADDADFEMWRTAPGMRFECNVSDMFALGDPRFNMHPGHIFWGTLALRLHNALADMVATERPKATDQEVFSTARHILSHVIAKIRTEDFVSDTIAPFRRFGKIAYHPPDMRQLVEFRNDFTPVWFEFNQLYRWHALIPDDIDLGSPQDAPDSARKMPLVDAMFNPAAFDLKGEGLGPLAGALKRTGLGRYGPRNTPFFLRHSTLRAIADGRAQRLRSFNDYREFFGLPRIERFEQFGMDPEATEAMAELYGEPDNVEYFVGIMCEVGQASGGAGRIRNNIMGDAQLALVSLFAVQDLVSLDQVRLPELWSERLLTKRGLEYIERFDLGRVIGGLIRGGGDDSWLLEAGAEGEDPVGCPFMTDDAACTPRSAQRPAHSRALRLENLKDFVGLDYFADWFYDATGGYMREALLAALTAGGALTLLYLAANHLCTAAVGRRIADIEHRSADVAAVLPDRDVAPRDPQQPPLSPASRNVRSSSLKQAPSLKRSSSMQAMQRGMSSSVKPTSPKKCTRLPTEAPAAAPESPKFRTVLSGSLVLEIPAGSTLMSYLEEQDREEELQQRAAAHQHPCAADCADSEQPRAPADKGGDAAASAPAEPASSVALIPVTVAPGSQAGLELLAGQPLVKELNLNFKLDDRGPGPGPGPELTGRVPVEPAVSGLPGPGDATVVLVNDAADMPASIHSAPPRQGRRPPALTALGEVGGIPEGRDGAGETTRQQRDAATTVPLWRKPEHMVDLAVETPRNFGWETPKAGVRLRPSRSLNRAASTRSAMSSVARESEMVVERLREQLMLQQYYGQVHLATTATVNAFATTMLAGPVSWALARILLSDDMEAEIRELYLWVLVSTFVLSLLYVAEACARAAQPSAPFVPASLGEGDLQRTKSISARGGGGNALQRLGLYAHHLCTLVLLAANLATGSIFVLKFGLLLIVFAYLEFPIFIAIALYRVRVLSDRLLKTAVFPVCAAVYAASRVVEAVLVVWFLVTTCGRMFAVGQGAAYVVVAAVGAFLVVMQFQILAPLHHMYSRLGRRD